MKRGLSSTSQSIQTGDITSGGHTTVQLGSNNAVFNGINFHIDLSAFTKQPFIPIGVGMLLTGFGFYKFYYWQAADKAFTFFPQTVPGFTQRKKEIGEIEKKLSQQKSQIKEIVLVGLTGTGKTELAKDYVRYYQNSRYHANKVYYIKMPLIRWLDGENPLRAYEGLAIHFGIDTQQFLKESLHHQGNDGKQLLYQNMLIQKVNEKLKFHPGWVLVWDNVRDYASIQPFIPKADGLIGTILFTTQNNLFLSKEKQISLNDGMSADDAINLLERISKFENFEEAKSLAKKLQYLPLALMSAGIYVRYKRQQGETQFSFKDYPNLSDITEQSLITEEYQDHYENGKKATQLSAVDLVVENVLSEEVRTLLTFCSLMEYQCIPEFLIEAYVHQNQSLFKSLGVQELLQEACHSGLLNSLKLENKMGFSKFKVELPDDITKTMVELEIGEPRSTGDYFAVLKTDRKVLSSKLLSLKDDVAIREFISEEIMQAFITYTDTNGKEGLSPDGFAELKSLLQKLSDKRGSVLFPYVENELQTYCKKLEMFEFYVKALGNTSKENSLQIGYRSALQYAKQVNMTLYVWRQDTNISEKLILIDFHKGATRLQAIHILHTNGFTHFSFLLKKPKHNKVWYMHDATQQCLRKRLKKQLEVEDSRALKLLEDIFYIFNFQESDAEQQLQLLPHRMSFLAYLPFLSKNLHEKSFFEQAELFAEKGISIFNKIAVNYDSFPATEYHHKALKVIDEIKALPLPAHGKVIHFIRYGHAYADSAFWDDARKRWGDCLENLKVLYGTNFNSFSKKIDEIAAIKIDKDTYEAFLKKLIRLLNEIGKILKRDDPIQQLAHYSIIYTLNSVIVDFYKSNKPTRDAFIKDNYECLKNSISPLIDECSKRGLAKDGNQDYHEALRYYEAIVYITFDYCGKEFPPLLVAHNLYNLSNVYLKLHNYSQALSFFYRAKTLYEKQKEDPRAQKKIVDCLINIGLLYKELNKLDDALKYLKESLILSEQFKLHRDLFEEIKEMIKDVETKKSLRQQSEGSNLHNKETNASGLSQLSSALSETTNTGSKGEVESNNNFSQVPSAQYSHAYLASSFGLMSVPKNTEDPIDQVKQKSLAELSLDEQANRFVVEDGNQERLKRGIKKSLNPQ